MVAKELIVVGGGEHARVVIDAARSQLVMWNVLGFVDPSLCAETCRIAEVNRLGDDSALPNYPGTHLVIGVGSIKSTDIRRQIAKRIAALNNPIATIVHRRATISTSAVVGLGAVIMAGAIVNAGAVIGQHTIINSGAIIEHDVHIGSFTHVSPGAVLGGGAEIGTDVHIGLGAIVRDHVKIADRTMVGMGAVVTASIPSEATVCGNPAKPLRSIASQATGGLAITTP